MTERDMEQRLRDALDHAAPDDIEGILSRCEMRKGTVIPMNELHEKDTKGKKHAFLRSPWMAAACVALVLAVGGGGVYGWQMQTGAVASMVSLDVNPSIRLDVNKRDRVVAAVPLNEDAAVVLEDMDLSGTDLNVAVNAVVGSLLQHGYLDRLSSAILISVEDDDDDRAQRLQTQLTDQVDSALRTAQSQASILSQTVSKDAQLQAQAQENHISTGKAALIQEIQSNAPALDFTKLAALSVEELQQMVRTKATQMPIGRDGALALALKDAGLKQSELTAFDVDSELDERPARYEVELRTASGAVEYYLDGYTGAVLSILTEGEDDRPAVQPPAAKETINAEQAKTIAFQHAGVDKSKATQLKLSRDYDDGRLVYEIEFMVGATEYEYDIDGVTGQVLDSETDWDDDHTGGKPTVPATGKELTAAQASEIALRDAGATAAQAQKLQTRQDTDDGRLVYEVKFWVGSTKYDYKLDALTGKILERESDKDDDAVPPASSAKANASGKPTVPATGKELTAAQASEIALRDAGATAAQAQKLQTRQDTDDGRLVYEVKFWVGSTKYDYEIDALTGKIVSSEKERDEDAPAPAPTEKLLTEERAKELALSHAGVTSAQAQFLKVELDQEDGRTVYEVDFRAGSTKYDYEIHAVSGKVLSSEQERDDDAPAPAPTEKLLTEERAKELALSHAEVTADQVKGLKAKLDEDDGRSVYEVEFRIDRVEYDYEIDAVSGAILSAERDDD